ncbi:MAG: hypothetical protein K2Z80_02055 [Xanthobacteraceae bacterium]|nr:hypothetical protein [Xanthobacteraceae bacterium]
MRMLIKASLIALAAVIAAGTLDTASAAKKKRTYTHRDRAPVSDQEQRKRDFDRDLGIRTDADGTPIIMRGYGSRTKTVRAMVPEAAAPGLRTDRPRPYGSSTYIPPPVPSPNAGPTPQEIIGQQTVRPYMPPPINTFGDRVTNCIHSFPLNRGLGNNPLDQQMYIRQCAN